MKEIHTHPDKSDRYMPKTERQLIKHVDVLIDHFGARSLEEIIKVRKAGKKKRCYNLSKKDYAILNCIYNLDFLTTEQIKELFFPDISDVGVWYHLNKFSKHNLLTNNSYYAGGDERWSFWELTDFGLETLAKYREYRCRQELGEPRTVKWSQVRYDFAVNQIFVDLAKTRGGVEMLLDEIYWHPSRDRGLPI